MAVTARDQQQRWTAPKPVNADRKIPWKIISQMAVFYIIGVAFMAGHLGFFLWLDGKPVSLSGVSQSWQSAVANFFAIAVEVVLLGGIGVAYNQFLWRLLRRRSLKADTIDTLVTLVTSPWDLWRPDLYKDAILAVLIGILCALVPIAAVFPPGSLSVEYQDAVLPFTLRNVPTMNISDFGKGDMKDVTERSFLQLVGAMVWYTSKSDSLFNPRLVSMASGVLASGGPLGFPSPCDGSCSYALSIDGPRFHCEELPRDEGIIAADECTLASQLLIYRAEDRARKESSLVDTRNNTFRLSWFPDPINNGCRPQELKTLDCSMTLARYKLHIGPNTMSKSINVTIESDRDVWPEDGIPTSFYDEAFSGDESERDAEALANKFPLAQAYAISRAAISALAGEVSIAVEIDVKMGIQDVVDGPIYYQGNGTGIFGSPYIGLDVMHEPKFHITPDSIQSFLQDLVVSTIALSGEGDNALWTNQGDIEAMRGDNVYTFNEKLQFFVPYGMCLLVTAGIYVLGLWSLRQNDVSAGGSFLQFATTTATSRTLHQVAGPCSAGGAESVSQELRDLRLRFGTLRSRQHDDDAESEHSRLLVAGFGTESEIEGL